jgi:hypothetical protein
VTLVRDLPNLSLSEKRGFFQERGYKQQASLNLQPGNNKEGQPMKLFLSVLSLAILLFGSPSLSSAHLSGQGQTSYQLRCRGTRGQEMSFAIEPGSSEGVNQLTVIFTKGSGPADEGLAPGQCSWIDRGMWQQEPNRLIQNIYANSNSAADYLNSPSNYWTFYVFNTGKDYFRVTRSHFGKPVKID